MFKITYLFHSGFTIETDTQFIVFDYFKDNCIKQKSKDCGQLCTKSFPRDKRVTFFVSHAHYDHFDKEIFKFVEEAHYVISNDVKIKEDGKIKICAPYEKFEYNGLKIQTFGSTDAGLSFLIELDGKRVFHAGDLNWWHWEGESEAERDYAKAFFFEELDKLKGQEVDIAFFPVDPRLEAAYYYGGEQFIRAIKPKHFIPMHFQDSYSITTKFKKRMEDQVPSTTIYHISKRGETIELKAD